MNILSQACFIVAIVLALISLSMSGCGGSGSSAVTINQQQSQGGGAPSSCTTGCTLECADSGGLSFQVTCNTFESEDVQQSGVAATVGQLPIECLDRPIPNCGTTQTETNADGSSSSTTTGTSSGGGFGGQST